MRYLFAGFCLALTSFALSAQCPNLLWEDDFDAATLNTSDWNYLLGDGCDINLCGWGNNELQFYQQQNAVVEDGKLKITARRESVGGRNYTSARISTKDKRDFKYGYMEAKMKLPAGGGLWPAFWMLSTDEVYGFWPQSGEIDIMEWVGNQPEKLFGTLHFGQPSPNNSSTGTDLKLRDMAWSDREHVFAVHWEPNRIRWFVDGYLFGTKTNSDTAPQRWPFDQDFHFLLNMAVGGNFGGNVDNTVFPATMEVDYVRVYDEAPAYLVGDRTVANGATGVRYVVENLPDGATVTWTVPDGATFTGATNAIEVDFGDGGGRVTATVAGDCGEYELGTDVFVNANFTNDFSFENFDEQETITFEFASGNLTEVDNPGANDVNGSTLVGRYERDGGTQFDVLVYGVTSIDNGDDYVAGRKAFSIDVYTQAPVGTEILLQLETATAQPENYPTGRHSRFVVATTRQNEWERLTFELLDEPDAGAAANGIQKIILLFASNTMTDDVYFFDNLDSYAENPDGIAAVELLNVPFTADPNPTGGAVMLRYDLPAADLHRVDLFDLAGRKLISNRLPAVAGENTLALDMEDLAAGVYFARLEFRGGVKTVKIVKR